MIFRGWLRLLTVASLLLASERAWAGPQAESYSEYEQETLSLSLSNHEATVDAHPEGKRVTAVLVDVLEVIEPRDPAPEFLNWFHSRTREDVIRRELLIKSGNRYDEELVRESERNLRSLRQESLVIIVPLLTDDPETVKLLVVAKDIWSLRLNSDYLIRGGQLELLMLQPAEENLFGTHRRLLGSFIYEPDTLSFGGRFIDPRMAGSRISWTVDANVIINQESGQPEGSYGTLSYGQPLFSTRQKWAWSATTSWRREVTRSFIGAQVRTYDAEATPQEDAIPVTYDSDVMVGAVGVTRSFGYRVKNNFTLGAQADRSVYRTHDLSGFDPRAVDAFVDELVPRSETRNGPYLQYHLYLNQFESLVDIETMGLQEGYLVGPDLYMRLYPVSQVFGADRDFIGYSTSAAYTQRIGDGLVRVYASGRIETELKNGGAILRDSRVQAGARVVTPKFGAGRLVMDAAALYRPDNFSNNLSSLGGEGRLRGYASAAFLGENFVASNLEFRSRALTLGTVLLRGALFYDVGDAFMGTALHPKQGAGFGLRALFPQLGRAVMRLDWGFALTPEFAPPSAFDGLLFTFRQAFGVPRPGGSGVALGVR